MRRVIDMNGKTEKVLRGGKRNVKWFWMKLLLLEIVVSPSNLNDDCSKFGSWLEQSLVLRLD